MPSCPVLRIPPCERAVGWDRSCGLFVQTVVLNVARDVRIDQRVDGLSGSNPLANLCSGDEDRLVLQVNDSTGSDALGELWRRRWSSPRQYDETGQRKERVRILPGEELRCVIVADDPVERGTGIEDVQRFQRVDCIRDAAALQLERRDVKEPVSARGQGGHGETVISGSA